MAEKLSVVMARRHIRMAHVVLLVLDATEGVVGLDATIAGYAHEGGRAIIVCVNKSDELPRSKKQEFEEQVRDTCKFLDYAPVVFISAKTGLGVNKLFPLIKEVYESASKRVTTGELNRFVESLQFEDRKIYYVTQASIRPPEFVVFTNKRTPCISRTSAIWSTKSGGNLDSGYARVAQNALKRGKTHARVIECRQ